MFRVAPAAMRCGWVKTSKSSPRTSAIKVMPASSAVRIASAVGADTAMMKDAPIAAVFCTISTETLEVTTTAPVVPSTRLSGQRPGQLVERIVAADILARLDDALAGNVEARGMHRAGLRMQRLDLRQKLDRLHDVGGGKRERRRADTVDRSASPPRSIRCRKVRSRPGRPAAAAAPRSACWPGPSAGSGCRCRRRDPRPRWLRSRPAKSMMPSVSEKPSAKSSKSAGHAIITACVVPAKENATGVSSGTMRFPATVPLGGGRGGKCRLSAGRRIKRSTPPLRAARDAPALLRLLGRTRSATPIGPLDGDTCTAVTLYSGQLVAQSEKSVVMTLACVSGWWKVV